MSPTRLDLVRFSRAPCKRRQQALVARTFLLLKKANSSDSRQLAPYTRLFFGANFRRKAHVKKYLPKRKRVFKMMASSNSDESLTCNRNHSSILDYQGATSTVDLWGWRNQILASHLLHSPLLIYFLMFNLSPAFTRLNFILTPPPPPPNNVLLYRVKVRNH
jgi:hypothetical protein